MNVEWISDRIIKIKCEVEDEIINVLSVYAPQVGCKEEEKKIFWEELEDTIRDIPVRERTWLGDDLNGHVGKKVAGDGDTVGQYGMGERNTAGENIVQFASQMNMAIINTYFKKDETSRHTRVEEVCPR